MNFLAKRKGAVMLNSALHPRQNGYAKDNNFILTPKEIEADIEGQSSSGLDKYEYLRITDTTPIPEPEPVLILCGETIAVQSDIFTISGASKSGKSAFAGMAIAASLTNTGQIPDGIAGLQIKPNPNCRAVVHIDTEQAKHKQQTNVRNVLKRSGFSACPSYYFSYNIRQLPLAEYSNTTEGIIKAAAQECNGIHSIWVDGGADYIAGVNDEATANEAVRFFENLAIEYDTAVFLIVHTNPGGDKERGHFGSQCQRKSGGILSIKNDPVDDSSYIEAKLLRYAGKGDIPKLSFKWDIMKGYHIGIGNKIEADPELERRKKKISEAFQICLEIFSAQRSYSYGAAIDQIQAQTLKSTNPCKAIFSIMKSQEMIIQGEDKNWRINKNYNATKQ
jgi:hypothetical protein